MEFYLICSFFKRTFAICHVICWFFVRRSLTWFQNEYLCLTIYSKWTISSDSKSLRTKCTCNSCNERSNDTFLCFQSHYSVASSYNPCGHNFERNILKRFWGKKNISYLLSKRRLHWRSANAATLHAMLSLAKHRRNSNHWIMHCGWFVQYMVS